jgi:hypothetical protein
MDGTLVETELLRRPSAEAASTSAAAQRQLAALADQAAAYEFNPHVSSGTCIYSEHGVRPSAATGVHWQLDVAQQAQLTLQEFSLCSGFLGRPVRCDIGISCMPACVVVPQDQGTAAYLLTSSGHLVALQLQHATTQATGNKPMLSIKAAGVTPMQAALAPCGTPLAMCAAGGYICISGTTDVVASIPVASLPADDGAAVAHIQASKWMIERLVGGLFSLGKKPPVCAIFPVQSPDAQLLGLLQQDCTLRLVDLARQQQVAQLHLEPADRQLQPSFAKAIPANDRSGSLLVVELQKDMVRPARSVLLADLEVAAGGRASLDNRRDLQLPSAEAKLEDAVLEGARLLALLAADARPRVCAFDATNGRFLADASLLHSGGPVAAASSAAVVHLVGCAHWTCALALRPRKAQAAAPPRCRPAAALPPRCALPGPLSTTLNPEPCPLPPAQDLWDSALAASGSSAEQHILGDLLVPGHLEPAALSDALAYYGSALSPRDCEAMSCGKLAGHVRAAVATSHARGSWHSVSHVWRAFVLTYGEAYARRHPVQALVRAGSHVGCLRQGALLTSLRCAACLLACGLPGCRAGLARRPARLCPTCSSSAPCVGPPLPCGTGLAGGAPRASYTASRCLPGCPLLALWWQLDRQPAHPPTLRPPPACRPATVEEELALPFRNLAGVPDAVATLWATCAELRALLGGPAADLFLARCLQGADVPAQLVPQYAALLLGGPSQVGRGRVACPAGHCSSLHTL